MNVRQFGLKNANTGDETMYDLMDLNHMFMNPKGLGWGEESTTMRIGQTFIETDRQPQQPKPSGEMWFSTYEYYEDFKTFCQVGGLVLCYKPSESIPWHYLDVSIQISKTEIDHDTGYLTCDTNFTGLSRWYEAVQMADTKGEVSSDAKLYKNWSESDDYAETLTFNITEATDTVDITALGGVDTSIETMQVSVNGRKLPTTFTEARTKTFGSTYTLSTYTPQTVLPTLDVNLPYQGTMLDGGGMANVDDGTGYNYQVTRIELQNTYTYGNIVLSSGQYSIDRINNYQERLIISVPTGDLFHGDSTRQISVVISYQRYFRRRYTVNNNYTQVTFTPTLVNGETAVVTKTVDNMFAYKYAYDSEATDSWNEHTYNANGTEANGSPVNDVVANYHYTYNAEFSGTMTFDTGPIDSYFRLSIFGPCVNPYYTLYVDNQPTKSGKFNLTLYANQKLVVDTHPATIEISKYNSATDEFLADCYGTSDFTTERIFTIPPGNSYITIGAQDGSPSAWIEVKKIV